jgi:histidinol phosphatase-like enzyme (inositol monophosphatase family)
MAEPLSPERLRKLDAFALELSAAAAEITLPPFRVETAVENKASAGFDPVTEADRGAEAAIRRLIAQRYPDHGVIGEEGGADRPDAEHVWVLDPIDGTRAFIAGLPLWTTLIALRFQGSPVLGVIGQPYLREFYVGSPALGSRLVTPDGERRLEVRACDGLGAAVISTTDPDLFAGPEVGAWTAVRGAARLARLGCDAYAYAMVALGTMDLVVESGLQPWDIEACVPIIEGAGGLVTDWSGRRLGREGGQVAAAGDPRVLRDALPLLRQAASAT